MNNKYAVPLSEMDRARLRTLRSGAFTLAHGEPPAIRAVLGGCRDGDGRAPTYPLPGEDA